ncbi:amino acid adenylation domain-containing protein [Mycolicibacterium sp. 22603]|uniref:amino acid adenylation domain-containing protein n=1 Tax=Mycolicibacterium sp. 22603 TaxID=3453950 RepID=UPI003F82AE4E
MHAVDEREASYGEARLWSLYRLDGPTAANNVPLAVEFRGPLDVDALNNAVIAVARRHVPLRTVYGEIDGRLRPTVVDPEAAAIQVIDCRRDELPTLRADLENWACDLGTEIPFRARLLRVTADEHVLSLVVHHIAIDGNSIAGLFDDLQRSYRAHRDGAGDAAEPPAAQYHDYVRYHRELLETPGLQDEQLEHWREVLDGAPSEIALPLDRPRPPVRSYRGDSVLIPLRDELSRRVTDIARAADVTPFVVLSSTVAAVLSRLGAGDDIPLGTPVAGRLEEEFDDLVGFFVNMLPLRLDLSGHPRFSELLHRSRGTLFAALSNQEVPFEKIVDAVNPVRSPNRNPLFQTLVSLQPADPEHLDLPEVQGRLLDPVITPAAFDIAFEFFDLPSGGRRLRIIYATDIFDRTGIELLGHRLLGALAAVAADPDIRLGDIPLVDDADRWSAVGIGPAGLRATVTELFDAQLRRTPRRIALRHGDSEIRYDELSDAADRLAGALADTGVRRGDTVAIALSRGTDLAIALLAVLRAGAAYLPIDRRYPAQRAQYMWSDAQPRVIIVDDTSAPDWSGHPSVPVTARAHPVAAPALGPDDAAYVVYTSGSTGRPKGVIGTHGALANRLWWAARSWSARGGADIRIAKSSIGFIDGSTEILGGLLAGSLVVIADDDTAGDGDALTELIERAGATQILAVPSLAGAIADSAPERLGSVARWICSGERLDSSTVSALRAVSPNAELVNSYGSTEVAGDVLTAVVDDHRVSLGRPVPGVTIHILGPHLEIVPPGVAGEIYVSGLQLARGYIGQPASTATRFIANPHGGAGERLYRTGDIAKWTPDHKVEYLGRADDQVSLHGFRIELAEVESALAELPGVHNAAAAVRENPAGGRRLVGYVTADDTVDPDLCRAALASRLPDYMVPATLVQLAEMPRGATGKIDRRALPDPQFTSASAGRAPSTEFEAVLCEVMAAAVGIPAVGPDDQFFAMGGDSMSAIRVASLARGRGVAVTPRQVLEHPTPAALAAVARSVATDGHSSATAGTSAAIELSAADRAELSALGPIDAALPLLPLQYGMYLHSAYTEPATDLYRIQQLAQLSGPLDPDALHEAVRTVIARHPALRVAVRTLADGSPVQVVLGAVEPHWRTVDLRGIDPDEAQAELRRIAAAEHAAPLALDRAPLLRHVLVSLADDDHRLVQSMHHIVADGWSLSSMFDEIARVHNAIVAGSSPEITVDGFADFVAHTEGRAESASQAWETILAEVRPTLLAANDSRAVASQDHREVSTSLSRARTDHLYAAARRAGVTAATAVHAAWGLALGRRLGVDSVVFGSLVSGRGTGYPGVESIIGLLINTVPVPLSWQSTDSLSAVATRLQEQQNHVLEAQHARLSDLTRSAGARALFDSVVVMENFPDTSATGKDRNTLTYCGFDGSSVMTDYPVALVADAADDLQLRLDYDPGLIGAAPAGDLLGDVVAILEAFADDPATTIAALPPVDAGPAAPTVATVTAGAPARAADTAVVAQLAGLYTDLLGVPAGADDDFFTLGGDSVLVIRLAGRARRSGLPLKPQLVFAHRTPAAVAAALTADHGHESAPAVDGPLLKLSEAERDRVAAATERTIVDMWPLSPLQAGIYFQARYAENAAVYILQNVMELRDNVDIAAMQWAYALVLERNPVLRSGFVADDLPHPVAFIAGDPSCRVQFVDLSEKDRDSAVADTRRLIEQDRHVPFDMTAPPLSRLTVIRRRGGDALILSCHVLLIDGWSRELLMRDLLSAYAMATQGRLSPPRGPVHGYQDYLRWLGAQDGAAAADYWAHVHDGLTEPTLLLPEAAGAEPAMTSRVDLQLSDDCAHALRETAQQLGVTLNALLTTALGIVLGYETGRNDVVFGTTVAGRPTEVDGSDAVIGLFLNTVPVRLRLDPGASVADTVRGAQADRLRSLDHEFLGLGDIQRAVADAHRGAGLLAGGGALFDNLFVLQNFWSDEAFADAESEFGILSHDTFDASHYPLTWVVAPGDTLAVKLEYRPDFVTESAARRLLDRYRTVVEFLATRPDAALCSVTVQLPDERASRAHRSSQALHDVPDLTIAEMLADYDDGDSTALVYGSASVTRTELDQRVSRLAGLLAAEDITGEDTVALAIPRSIDTVVALFAVLRAGAAYLPLELDYPDERLAVMLDDARPRIVLTTTAVRERIASITPADCSRITVDDAETRNALDTLAPNWTGERPAPGRPAYVIYTSGSTGKPKGVVTPYRGLTNMHFNHRDAIFAPAIAKAGGRRLRIAHTVSFAFDMSWEELLWLVEGHEVHICDEVLRRDAAALVAYCRAHLIDVINVTPTYAQLLFEEGLLDDGEHHPVLVLLGGEAVPPSVWERLRDDPTTYGYNLYGPTEYTINTLGGGTDDSAEPTVGQPIWNTDAHILDPWLRPVADGHPGELYIAGAGLARGYAHRFGLTAERFVANPYPTAIAPVGTRMYRTGDLVRRGADGNIEFLGRTDEQVKIRGHRVELGDVESAIVSHPSAAQAAVIATADPRVPGTQRLVAYLVPAAIPEDDRTAAESAHVGEWEQIYSDEYSTISTAVFVEDYAGWDSSYDGAPIPFEQMSEWRATTVAAIAELSPARILEIGVGTGLLLGQLAPRVEEYWGTDLAAPVIEALNDELGAEPQLSDRIHLTVAPAHRLGEVPTEYFDVVVINSVIQYFPSVRYLADVIESAARHLRPSGALFIGDVRNRLLLDTFHTAIALSRSASDSADAEQIRRAADRGVELEKELLLDPEFFVALAHRLGLTAEIRLKTGEFHNELSRHRYDVILRADAPAAPAHRSALHWPGDLETVKAALAEAGPDGLRVAAIPNGRLAGEIAATERLAAGDVTGARTALRTPAGVDPAHLYALAGATGWTVRLTWHPGDPALMDAVFTTTGEPLGDLYSSSAVDRPLEELGNNPAGARERSAAIAALRRHLRDTLPDYMVPSAFVALDRIPLTDNGKLDVRALPDADAAAPVSTSRAAQNPVEELLAELFAEVLGVDQVGVEDNFFDIGGHSLLTIRLMSRVRSAMGAELTIRDVFDAPTVAQLATKLRLDAPTRPELTAATRPERLPLSAGQERLFVLEQLGETGAAYNYPLTFRLRGPLDTDAFTAALTDVVDRHEVLRTVFAAQDGTLHQVILPAGARVPVTVLDCDESAVGDLVDAAANHRFDLNTEIPVRATIMRVADDDHVIALILHHIAVDEWSDAPLLDDLATAYRARRSGQAPAWSPLPLQYADYALWQQDLLASVAAEQTAFWTTTLAGAPDELALPTDRPRPARPSGAGGTLHMDLPASVVAGLRRMTAEHQVSTVMCFHAAVAALMHRLGAGEDIVVGTPVAGRTEAELNPLVGFFVNTVVLRVDVSGNPTFVELLDRVRDVDLAAFEHQDLPFDRVVEALNPPRAAGRNPLFQTFVGYHYRDDATADVLDLPTEWLSPTVSAAMFDLGFTLIDNIARGQMTVLAEFATDLFDPDTVERITERLQTLLTQVVAEPHTRIADSAVFLPGERQWLDQAGTGPVTPVSPDDLATIVIRQALRSPDAVAVRSDEADTQLTYAELDEWSRRLAADLAGEGAGPGTLIGLAVPRSVELVVALVAIARCGAAFLPLDSDFPEDRLQFMLDDAQPVTVLRDRARIHAARYGENAIPTAGSDNAAHGDSWAYVLYTSGTTGRPKGVPVAHRAIANRIAWLQQAYPLSADDRMLVKTPISFDTSVWEVFWPLSVGATLVLARPGGHREPRYLAETIAAHGVTAVDFVPSVLELFLDELDIDTAGAADLSSLTRVTVGGEALSRDLAERTIRHLGVPLHNLYGPTEAAVDVLGWTADGGPVAIGVPGANVRVHVLDSRLRPTPPGIPGELYLAGVQLADGYLGRHALTAERFVADPWGPAGARMYRTGDVVRWRADGQLEYRGRDDDQIKVRGVRIEPAEIEAVLARHPAISSVRVLLRAGALVAYYVCSGADSPTAEQLRRLGAQSLPMHMVPAAFVELGALPVTATGKLDRDALPDPRPSAGSGRAPVTPTEITLCDLVGDILGVDAVGLDDDFFALGGHSLSAIRLLGRIRAVLGSELSLRELFDAPTVGELSALVDEGSGAATARPTLTPRARPDRVPLSPGQSSMRLHYALEGPDPTYNVPMVWRVDGRFDIATLELALHDVIGRYEILRTIYPDRDGVFEPRVLDADEVDLRVELIADHELRDAARYCFRLDEQIPVKVYLATRGAESVLLVNIHHIATDEWSDEPLLRDLRTAYEARRAGRVPEWPALSLQYADYALWHAELLDGVAEDQLRYWREALAGVPEETGLPTDHPRLPTNTFRGGTVTATLPPTTVTALRALARDSQATMFMVAHSAVVTLLNRMGAGDDVVVGTPVSGRSDALLHDQIGYFLNTVVLRSQVRGRQTFAELLADNRAGVLQAFDHQDIPFDRIVKEVNPIRVRGQHPLFQIMMMYLVSGDTERIEIDGMTLTADEVDTGTAKFDLSIDFVEHADESVTLTMEYNADLFEASTIDALLARLVAVLDRVSQDAGVRLADIDMLIEPEPGRLAEWEHGAELPAPESTLTALFETQVRATPGALAIIDGARELTFDEVNRRANRLARHAIARGLGADDIAALDLARSADVLIAILAVHKAGGAYLALDADYPRERIAHMLADADPVLTITAETVAEAIGDQALSDADVTDAERRTPAHPDHAAYLIYTSGSTGKPKGVVVPQRSIVNLFTSHRERLYRPTMATAGRDQLRVGHAWSFAFDASWQPQLWLYDGHTICLVADETRRDPALLAAQLTDQRFDFIELTPSMFDSVARAGAVRDGVCRLSAIGVGGEAVPPELWAELGTMPSTRAYNLYGPTETTVDALVAEPDGSSEPKIGTPVANSTVYVLDQSLRRVPPGVRGELYVAGAGLARGYLGQSANTAQRFVANPYRDGERMYRTGDLVSWSVDGQLVYHGRADEQVKIRGYRVELGEIESALRAAPEVADAAVVARHDSANHAVLVGYAVRTPGCAPDPAELKRQLSTRLPGYMVPTAIVLVEAIPLLPNGKLNRAGLPTPQLSAAPAVPPRNELEAALCDAVASVIGCDDIGIHDDFFERGGDSVATMRLVAAAHAAGIAVSARQIFELRTVAELATVAETEVEMDR